jgi:hypothetical protein
MTDKLNECFDEMKISMRDFKKVIDQTKREGDKQGETVDDSDKRREKIKEKHREIYNATNCPPPVVLLYLLHESSRRSIQHAISGENRPQGQRPSGATRVPGHPRHLHHSEQSEATRHHPGCAFRASPHEAAAQRPPRPRPTRRSPRPSRHRQGIRRPPVFSG